MPKGCGNNGRTCLGVNPQSDGLGWASRDWTRGNVSILGPIHDLRRNTLTRTPEKKADTLLLREMLTLLWQIMQEKNKMLREVGML